MSLFSTLTRSPAGMVSPVRSDSGLHSLRAGALLRIDGAAEIACLCGRVWLTREGGAEDIVLDANERRRLPRGSRVLAEALRDAVIEARFP